MALANELISYIFLVVMGIIPIANPFSTAPLFISMTAQFSPVERRMVAAKACFYMSIILLAFLFLGVFILEFFGISLVSVRLAGGLIITYIGFQMLFPAAEENAETNTSNSNTRDASSVAFTPLALPMLSGPGSISVVLAMAAQVSSAQALSDEVTGYAIVAVGIILSSCICWLVLRGSSSVVRFMGKNGIDASTKLMGFILVCIGIEFLLKGWAMIQSV